ncbi:MAG: 1-acyl-sn-glycerol-3-phosphate acyltransferase [Desulfobacteraceae bacterium]|nr:1-acyl-sn-glycerol-3-phosphate acyltransferase [Desulfobacteraceae bacterium]
MAKIRDFFQRCRKSFRAWVEVRRSETHDHYICFLPQRLGAFTGFLLRQFFSGIRLETDQTRIIQSLPEQSVVVYITKKKSVFEFLFYHSRYLQRKLPQPQLGFDCGLLFWQPLSRLVDIVLGRLIFFSRHRRLPDRYESGYVRQKLLAGSAGFLALVGERGFRRRFVKAKTDPLLYLIDVQNETDRPIYLVPQLIFFGKTPLRSVPSFMDVMFGPEIDPGPIRKAAILVRNPHKVFVEVSEPVSLRAFIDNNQSLQNRERLALDLRMLLLERLNRHQQTITGPVLKSSEELKERILTSDRLQSFMALYSKKRDMPIYRVRKKADAYLDEIAAKYNSAMIKAMEVMVGWITRTMFDGVSVNREKLQLAKSMSRRGPLILIPCHRSHIDYLILSYLMYHADMPCPHVAAGKNLSFWPLGPLFRSGGAFFIRRTFRGALLYSKVFAEYIRMLLSEGFNIEFFIEGGRSRTGKMILPKLGLLSTLLNAYKDGACEDMIFVPIYIGYDRVLEETAYLNEIEGKEKEPENLKQMLKVHQFLSRRYGRIYVRFSDPISFTDLLDQMGARMEEMTAKEQSALCRNLGHRIINAINLVTVVTPHALVASAMLNIGRKRFSRDQMMEVIEFYLSYLLTQGAMLADTLLLEHGSAIDQVIETYEQRKFVERISLSVEGEEREDLYTVNESKRPNLEYYKNNVVSFFVPAAFTALAILERDAFQFTTSDLYESYRYLREYFKDEFAYDVDQPPEYFVRKNIKAFIDDAVLMPHPTLPETYNLTSAGFRKLKLFCEFLQSYFESYLITLQYFKNAPPDAKNGKEQLKKIVSTGNRMYKLEEIERKESLSEINYRNAVKFFSSRGISSRKDADLIESYTRATQRYLRLMVT